MKFNIVLKVLIVIGLGASSGLIKAATPEQIEQECERQMLLGICITRAEKSLVNPNTSILISGAGRVSYAAYLEYIDKYDIKNPNNMAMCKLALHYMKFAVGSDQDKIARALWTPTAKTQAPNK